ncbi:MAG: hypothetical protein WAN31_00995, partial [Methylovirgula sp.]
IETRLRDITLYLYNYYINVHYLIRFNGIARQLFLARPPAEENIAKLYGRFDAALAMRDSGLAPNSAWLLAAQNRGVVSARFAGLTIDRHGIRRGDGAPSSRRKHDRSSRVPLV